MSRLELDLPDDQATTALGHALAGLVRSGDVIALHGGLGAGKTTLARGLICALAGEPTEVPSPTFTLVQTYPTAALTVWHFDLYRLETPDELIEIGWQEAADGLALVEWPDRAGDALPAQRLDVFLRTFQDGRRVGLEPHGEDWQTRVDGFQFRSA